MELTNNLGIKRIKAQEPDLADTKKEILNFFRISFLVGAEGVEPPTTLYHLTCCFLDPNIIQTNAIFKRRSQILNTAKICKLYDKNQNSRENLSIYYKV
jgi:hypothetical protein